MGAVGDRQTQMTWVQGLVDQKLNRRRKRACGGVVVPDRAFAARTRKGQAGRSKMQAQGAGGMCCEKYDGERGMLHLFLLITVCEYPSRACTRCVVRLIRPRGRCAVMPWWSPDDGWRHVAYGNGLWQSRKAFVERFGFCTWANGIRCVSGERARAVLRRFGYLGKAGQTGPHRGCDLARCLHTKCCKLRPC